MARTAEVHRLRSGFVLILISSSEPRSMLHGNNDAELAAIGKAWVESASCREALQRVTTARDGTLSSTSWHGVERRHQRF